MQSLLVVLDHPPPDRFAYVLEGGKQVLIEDFLTEGAVEAFDVGVLVRLARLDVLDGHGVGLGPLHERFAQELRAVVRAQHLRQAVVPFELLKDAHQVQRASRLLRHRS